MNEGSEAISELARYVKLRTILVDKLMVLRVNLAEMEREKQRNMLEAKRASNWKVTDHELGEEWNKSDQGKQEAALRQLISEAESVHQRINDQIRRLRASEPAVQPKKAVNN